MSKRINENYFDDKNRQYYCDIGEMLSKDEEIQWEGKPKRFAYTCSLAGPLFVFALIWLCFDGFFIYMLASSGAWEGMEFFMRLGLVGFFAIHLMPVWITISKIVRSIIERRNVRYVLTNKRILIRTGIIPDIKIIDYKDVTSVTCKVGAIDKMLGVGDIYISHVGHAGHKIVLFDISDPRKVANALQIIVMDKKSTIGAESAVD